MVEIIQCLGVEVKKGGGQYFELNGEDEKRDFKKMGVSRNYDKRWGDRNFTSTLLKIGLKIVALKSHLSRKPLMDKALVGGREVRKCQVRFQIKSIYWEFCERLNILYEEVIKDVYSTS